MRKKLWKSLLSGFLISLMLNGIAQGNSYPVLCEQKGIQENVIGWLEILGADILEPVMRHKEDDAYYAKHSAEGKEQANGAVYVQAKYNAADFSDPVTLIYGSSASEDAVFGKLQQIYSGSFEACRTVYLHAPEGTYEYRVFAALPYTSIHILYYYDFQKGNRFDAFFDSVFSTRALGMHLDEDNRPMAGEDQVLIFSTGLRGDSLQRYLVMAKRITIKPQ